MAQATGGDLCPQERTAGIDWFRYKAVGRYAQREAQEAARAIQEEDVAEGEERKKWNWQGYKGQRTKRIRWARKGDNLYWETSGEWADGTWHRMPRSSGLASRIDLALTLRFSSAQTGFDDSCIPSEETHPSHRLPSGTPFSRLKGADGLRIGTVGNRTGPEYFRLYDKGVESGAASAGYIWRLELEAKFALAEELCRTLRDQLQEPAWVGRYVTSRWQSLGLPWPIREHGRSLPAVVKPGRPVSSSDALLKWMGHSVRPVVRRLLYTVSVEQLLDALGLSTWAMPRAPRDDAR